MLPPDRRLVLASPTGRHSSDLPSIHLVRQVYGRWRSLCGRSTATWTLRPQRPRTDDEAYLASSCQHCRKRFRKEHPAVPAYR